jgi:hypothetical protein
MATVYGSKVNNVWRSYLTYTITDNPANVVVTLEGGINIPNDSYTTKRQFTDTLYQGSTSLASGTHNSERATLTGVYTQSIATKTLTFNKTSAKQSITFKNTLNGGDNTSSSASYTLQIDAVTAYSVTYYANGGSGTVPSTYTTKVHGVALTLPTAAQSGLSRTDYTLISWNTAADGSGTSYALGGTLPATVNADTTLYAIWRKNYVAPTITDVQIFRTASSSSSTQTDDGQYVYVHFSYTNGVVNGTSTLPSCQIKIGSSTYTPTLSGGTFTNRYGTFSANNSYAVTITLSNSGYSDYATVYTANIPTATYPMDILGTGQAMGLMHVAVSGQKITMGDTWVDGTLYANSGTRVPKITITTTAPTASQGSNGDIWLVYTA